MEKEVFETISTDDGYVANIAIRDVKRPLIYTFDNMWSAGPTAERKGWGYDWLLKQQFNVICLLESERPRWYRGAGFVGLVEQVAEITRKHGLSRRITYGSSMGGYAATAFADALLADTVVTISPISTLNEDLAPWEKRFSVAKAQNWSTSFFDGPQGCRNVKHSYVLYDPLLSSDAAHVNRYKARRYKIPGLGHGLESYAQPTGVVGHMFVRAVEMNQCEYDLAFIQKARKRRGLVRYYQWLLGPENMHLTKPRKLVIFAHFLRMIEDTYTTFDEVLDAYKKSYVRYHGSLDALEDYYRNKFSRGGAAVDLIGLLKKDA